jgi:hypothetical protein
MDFKIAFVHVKNSIITLIELIPSICGRTHNLWRQRRKLLESVVADRLL